MRTRDEKRTGRNLTIFGVSVLALAVLAGVVRPFTVPPDAEPGTPGLAQLFWLVTPALVALLLRILSDGWDDLGLRPNFRGNGFWWAVSVLVFPVVIALSVLIGVGAGALELDSTSGFVSALLTGLVGAAIKNLFEEFAWRGYLAPKVYSLKLNAFGANVWLSHAIVGLVWGAWHLPFVLVLWTYLTPGTLWLFVPLLLVGTYGQSIVYGEIRLATGSVLPAWVMHTIGNAIGNALLLGNVIRLVPGRELWASPGAESVISIVLMFAVGYWLHRRRKNAD